jgi:hypothetical protein
VRRLILVKKVSKSFFVQGMKLFKTVGVQSRNQLNAEAGTITFILISDHILDHCSKIDLRSYQDHIAVK